MSEAAFNLDSIVWAALGLRTLVFLLAAFFVLYRTLKIRKAIEERSFAGRYSPPIILKGVFSPLKGWEEPFDAKDIEVLKATRAYMLTVVLLTLFVIFVNQEARGYVEEEFQRRGYSTTSN